jgi:hypothetical protein
MEEFLKKINTDLIKKGNDPFYAFPLLEGKSLEEAKKEEYYPFIYALNMKNNVIYPGEEDQPDLEVHRLCWELKIREFNERWALGFSRFIQKCDAIKTIKVKTKPEGFGATVNFMRHGDDEVGSLFTDRFINFCKSKEIKNYYIAIEYGKNNNNPHAHLYLDYYDRRRCGGGTGLNETAKPRSLRYELHKLLPTSTDIQVKHNPRLGSWYKYCTKEESEKKTFVEEFQ